MSFFFFCWIIKACLLDYYHTNYKECIISIRQEIKVRNSKTLRHCQNIQFWFIKSAKIFNTYDKPVCFWVLKFAIVYSVKFCNQRPKQRIRDTQNLKILEGNLIQKMISINLINQANLWLSDTCKTYHLFIMMIYLW